MNSRKYEKFKKAKNWLWFQWIVLVMLLLIGLGAILNETKSDPKDTSHWREDRAEIFY